MHTSETHGTTGAWLFLGMSIVLSAAAQLFMKASMIHLKMHGNTGFDMSLVLTIIGDHTVLVWLLAGLVCYAVSMLCWMFALTRYELNFAYPFLGITYVLVYLGAAYWDTIGEQLSWQRTVGIVLVLTGVMFVNYTSSRK